jgi:hypothetical protein
MPRQAPSAPVQRVVGGGARQPARVPGPRSGAQPIVASGALFFVVHACSTRAVMLSYCYVIRFVGLR